MSRPGAEVRGGEREASAGERPRERSAREKVAGSAPRALYPKPILLPSWESQRSPARKSALCGPTSHLCLPSGPSRPMAGLAEPNARDPSGKGASPKMVSVTPLGKSTGAPCPPAAHRRIRLSQVPPAPTRFWYFPPANRKRPSSDQATLDRLSEVLPVSGA